MSVTMMILPKRTFWCFHRLWNMSQVTSQTTTALKQMVAREQDVEGPAESRPRHGPRWASQNEAVRPAHRC